MPLTKYKLDIPFLFMLRKAYGQFNDSARKLTDLRVAHGSDRNDIMSYLLNPKGYSRAEIDAESRNLIVAGKDNLRSSARLLPSPSFLL